MSKIMVKPILLLLISFGYFNFFLGANAKISVNSLKKLGALNNNELLQAYRKTEQAFTSFLALYKKNYTGAEYLKRLKVFETNVITAIETQLIDPTAVHGVTQFFDLTEEEFANQYLGLRVPGQMLGHPSAPPLPTDNLPTEFDWREKGAVTPVKNQGACGSCFAFSTVGALEGAHFLKTGELVSLSEQQIVDCDRDCDPSYYDVCDDGCNGGLMNNAINYIIESGGLQTEEDYPYTARVGNCKFNAAKDKVSAAVAGYEVISKDEKQIAANLVKYGPLAIAINANWMQSYVKGVSCPILCNKKGLNHGVLLVGYGEADFSIARLKKKPYWIIKNSWGPGWGEDGYYRVCSGLDMCGLDSMVSLVLSTDLKKEGEDSKGVEVQ